MRTKWLFSLPVICLASSIALGAFNTTPPTTGAYSSGTYRNLFAEIGKTGIDAKISAAWDSMFLGSNKLYYSFDADEYYIKDVGSNDIRSEGMSYGMLICVMMNKPTEFNNLWRFAYTRMKRPSNLFAWQVNLSGVPIDTNPAPDGEEYFATALFCAAARWNGGAAPLDYFTQAKNVVAAIKTKLINNTDSVVVFSPGMMSVADPSYVLPAFYSYWADMTGDPYWTRIAAKARTYLNDGDVHNQNNGLSPYQTNTNATPRNTTFNGYDTEMYMEDSWRTIMNVGMDAHLFGAAAWHTDFTNDLFYFLHTAEGLTTGGICNTGYSQRYNWDGSDVGVCNTSNYRHGEGQMGANAAGALCANNATQATASLEELWNAAWPTGTWRYYQGCLYMLGMLHSSGKFILYRNLAIGKTATQSSTYSTYVAGKAIDNNTNGVLTGNSVSHTNSEAGAWLRVDLGANRTIEQVWVWNRTDADAAKLANFDVQIGTDGTNYPTSAYLAGTCGSPSKFSFTPVSGRYIRVKLRGTNNLHMAEINVWGK